MSYGTFHWRVVNALRRCFALSAVVAGVAFLGDATGLAARAGLMDAAPPRSAAAAVGLAALGVGLLVAGLVLCRRPTYRPDLGDVSWWAGKAGGYEEAAGRRRRESRTWLTGDPKSGSGERST